MITPGMNKADVAQIIHDLCRLSDDFNENLTWAQARQIINELSGKLDLDGIIHRNSSGLVTRNVINEVINQVPLGVDLYLDFLNQRYFGGVPTDTHATDILALSSTGYETFAPNVPPRTDLGLLTTVERTNIVRFSADAVNGAWSVTGGPPKTAVTGPFLRVFDNGVTVESAGATWHRINSPSFALEVGTQYAVQAWFKAGSSGRARIVLRNNTETIESFVHGEIGGNFSVGSENLGAVTDIKVTDFGSGIHRVEFLVDVNATGASCNMGIGPDTAIAGGDVITLGAQVEPDATFATDPIITEGSAVTRPGNRPVVAVPDGPRAFVLDMDLLDPPVTTGGITYMADYSIGNGGERISFVRSSAGNFTLDLAYNGSYAGSAPGTLPLTQGRNILFGVAANGYVRKGMVGQSDPPERTDLSLPSGITALGFGSRWWNTTSATYMRTRQFAEFRNIADPAAAFAQAKALAQEWAAE